ncbi:MAG TPA: Ni/Fe hydrogenase subunit alpha [Candidatus Acidoferrales bacterium]|nr:Ni/Fe hydrogenase subunit alpha [Candidatus Acidoferrales bacterium]
MAQKKIVIDPVTRIEGHSKISIHLDEQGHVEEAYFHVTQFRGFEKFCEGRPFYEMPSLMARICGICPVSHLIASAKACDQILAVAIPPNAARLRKVLNLAQIVQSHALSFFYLSSPDLLMGMDSDPAARNVLGVAAAYPAMARDGVRLRQFGQSTIESLAGKRIHPAWVVPGGVSSPLTAESRDRILAQLPEMLTIATRTLDWFKSEMEKFREEIRSFANFPTLFMALVGENGGLEHYDGQMRFLDSGGKVIADYPGSSYAAHIAEIAHPWSYLKTSFYKPMGYPDGVYRVGPLARLNVIDSVDTPRASQEWAEFRELDRGPVLSSFYYHYARLVEILYGLEKMEQLLSEDDILDPLVRAHARVNNGEGIGVSEAPRGTLLHHYKVDRDGLITWSNLIIATGHNNAAMNRGVLQVARHFVHGNRLEEGMLNRVEAVIRSFDPCLSCSTHADGRLALEVELRNARGEVVDSCRTR